MEGPTFIFDALSQSLPPHRIKNSILEIRGKKEREERCVINLNDEGITPLEDLLSEFYHKRAQAQTRRQEKPVRQQQQLPLSCWAGLGRAFSLMSFEGDFCADCFSQSYSGNSSNPVSAATSLS